MARFLEFSKAPEIFNAVEHWKKNCLLRDGSVFTDSQIWTSDNFQELHKHFIEAPDTGDQRFIEKLKKQLAGSTQILPKWVFRP